MKKKVTLYAIVLVIISILLTVTISYLVTQKIIYDKYQYINHISTEASVDKANVILNEIASIIDLSIKNEALDYILDNKETNTYEYYNVAKNYELYLRKLIMHYDKVDALLLVTENQSFSASNTVGNTYGKYKEVTFFQEVKTLIENRKSNESFFLDTYIEDDYNSISILSPVFKPYGDRIEGIAIIVLNKSFIEQLQFPGENVYITDQLDNTVSLEKTKNSTTDINFKSPLNFDGWFIQNTLSFNHLHKQIITIVKNSIKFGIIYLILIGLITHFIGKRISGSINNISKNIHEAKSNNFQSYNASTCYKKRFFSLHTWILIYYVIIVIIPILIITALFYTKSQSIVQDHVGSAFESQTNNAYNEIDFIFSNYERTTKELIFDDAIQEYYNEELYTITPTAEEYIPYKKLITHNIKNLSLYNTDYSLLHSTIFSRNIMAKQEIFTDLKYIENHYGKPLWEKINIYNLNSDCYRVGMQIRNISNKTSIGKLLGYALVDLDASIITQATEKIRKYGNAEVYLLDSASNDILGVDSYDKLQNTHLSESNFALTIINQKKYYVFNKKFTVNDWSLVVLFPLEEYFLENVIILYSSIIIIITMFILSFFISYGFSIMLGKNISALLKVVRKVKKGHLSIRFQPKKFDEISELGIAFNGMLEKLNHIIKEKLETEIRAKDAELKAKESELNLLQSQINPHFLYNTLKTVQYMVFINDERAVKMIKLLIYLFRNGINRGEKLITIKDEIKYIKTYLEIQLIRFSNKFDVIYDIPDEIMDYKVLKLTLQPIVENAIYHGLEIKENKGTLLIRGEIVDEEIHFTIKDTGVGMNAEKLLEVRERLNHNITNQSIGIINVHERIKLYFGNEYGLSIDSEKNRGTTVMIKLPIQAFSHHVYVDY